MLNILPANLNQSEKQVLITSVSSSDHSYIQSVTKCHKVSQSSLNTHLEMVWVGGEWWWWKPILVYSSGPTFELELELESDLT